MSTFIEQIHEKAKASPRKVVLQEGEDVRVIEAASRATKLGIAEMTILGDAAKIKATAAAASLSLDKVNVVDMTCAPNLTDYAGTYFELRKAKGMTEEEARSRFGFFLEALEYGTPPHGGIALGLDRIVMILAGADSLREVIPFPKTAAAKDLMVEAPTPVAEGQLRELGIQVKK